MKLFILNYVNNPYYTRGRPAGKNKRSYKFVFPFIFGIINSVEMLVAGSFPSWERTFVCLCLSIQSHRSSVWATFYFPGTKNPALSALKQYWQTDGQTDRHVFSRLFDSCACFALQAIRHAILSSDTHEREPDRNVMARHKELTSVTWLSVVHGLHHKIIGLLNIIFSSLLLTAKHSSLYTPRTLRLETIQLTRDESGLFPLSSDSI